ncbi:hypothetical protein JB92DRAFT_1484552 [Gautieria morchelliformis]|nr:hypothetical protein JB92DRAFT_1484552 [Gautieria morchelliformis]
MTSYPFNLSIFRRKGGGGGGRSGTSGGGKSASSSPSSSKGGSKGPSFGVSSSSKSTSRTASSSSRGGGSVTVIPSGSLFAGRLSGGATRDSVYGNSRIGTGYTYGGYGSFYGGRPFPYGFYPVYIERGYYGGDEYGPTINGNRTGGPLSTAIVQPLISTPEDSYYLIGDQASVSVVLNFLIPNCGIADATVTNTYINGTSVFNGTALVPHPEQVVQYYRSSSMALALLSYNNSAALLSRAPASNASAPPPSQRTHPSLSG